MIGIDIEQIKRFEHWNDEGFERVFSKGEIEYAKTFVNSIEHFCGFFCVKEAFAKAVDNEVHYTEIEVIHNEEGKPFINMTPYIKSILREHGFEKLDISISHSKDYAVAIVLAS